MKGHQAPDSQYEQHEEEQDREEPRHGVHFCYSVGVGDEGEACASRAYNLIRGHSKVVGQVSENPEDRDPRKERREGIQSGDDQRVPVDIVFEVVVRRKHDNGTEADVQGEETLRDRGIPHLATKS